MFGQDFSVGAAAAAGAALTPVSRPQPEQRVVESTAHAQLRQRDAGSNFARAPSALEQLSSSARQFADVLDATGSVQVASSVSGFQAGHLDMYV